MPDPALDPVRQDGVDHSIPKTARSAKSIAATRGSRCWWHGFILGLGLLRSDLPFCERFVEYRLRPWIIRFLSRPTVEVDFECRGPLEHGGRRPVLRRSSSPRGMNEADGHLQFLMQFADEVIADGGKGRDGIRRANMPLANAIIIHGVARRLCHGEHPDLGVVRRSLLLLEIAGLLDCPLHVRLPRAN